jgi:hypothetical protein
VGYKFGGKSKTWTCNVSTYVIGKVNPAAKRSVANWFPKKMYTIPNSCRFPAELMTSLLVQRVQLTSRAKFTKLWPTTGKAVNAETGAKIPVGLRTFRVSIGL